MHTKASAFYSPLNQCIQYNTVSRSDYDYYISNPEMDTFGATLKIIVHELRHYLDHISTVWGQQNLVNTFNAYAARLSDKESRFHEIASFWSEVRRNKSLVYYYTRNESYRYNKTPWLWSISLGHRFDSKGRPSDHNPIIFTKFAAVSGKGSEFVCRVPFTIGSLLEVNAKSEEYSLEESYIRSMSKKEREEDLPLYIEGRYGFLYNQFLAEYTVAAHLTANTLRTDNFVLAYDVASSLATLSLDIPPSLLAGIKCPKIMDGLKEKHRSLLHHQDRGYLFVCLLRNASDAGLAINTNIDDILAASGLPPMSKITRLSLQFLDDIPSSITATGHLNDRLRKLLALGKEYFNRRSLDGKGFTAFDLFKEQKNLPPMRFSGMPEAMDGFDIKSSVNSDEDWQRFANAMRQKIDEFINVCID